MERLDRMYRQMVRMRVVEEWLLELSASGKLRGSLHLAQGQEALPAAVSEALRKDDYLTATYRGHGYVLAKGCDSFLVLSEILGKSSGLAKGKGGKMHLFDPEFGVLGTNGIVGAGVGTAAGAALGAKLRKTDQIAMTVLGDGALNQGHVSECFNLAALFKLPLIFLCENNLYAEMTPLERSHGLTDLCRRVEGFGIRSMQVDGNDPEAAYDVLSEAATFARSGQGPVFIEAATYRTIGHYQADPGTSYRSAKEVEDWKRRSPLLNAATKLGKRATAIESEVRAEMREVFERVLAQPVPNPGEASTEVFA